MATLMERFLRHVSKPEGRDGCWMWTGSTVQSKINGGGGYGKMGGAPDAHGYRKTLIAHRVSYELFIGPIAPGLEIDHTCHNPIVCPGGAKCPHRRCVNPLHLRVVTHSVNMQRVNLTNVRKAASLRAVLQTHCLRGHEFNEVNTYIDKRMRKHCKLCVVYRRERKRAA